MLTIYRRPPNLKPVNVQWVPPGIEVPPSNPTWHIQYTGTMNWNRPVDVYNVDAFDTSAAQVSALKARGVYPIAYMSLGTAEDWRPDFANFTQADLGNEMTDWEGKFYVDVTSANVRSIMAARLDMIKSKGFLGVDPDNVDGYLANTGFPDNQNTTAYREYMLWFAAECAARGLACGLKNGQDMINSELLEATYFHVVESCELWSKCAASNPYVAAGKPVFHIAYEEEHNGDYSFIPSTVALGLRTVVKNYSLDAWSVDSWSYDPGSDTELIGVGSTGTSLIDYPKTGPITVGNLYVSAHGSDSNPGTMESPKATIQGAINAASANDTILVFDDGLYTINSSIEPNKSGLKIFGYGTQRPRIHRSATIHSRNNSNFVFYVGNGVHNIHIKGFEITGGRNNTNAPHNSHVIRADVSHNFTVEDLIIHSGETGSVSVYDCDDFLAIDVITLGNTGAGDGTNRPDGIAVSSILGGVSNRPIVARCLAANCDDDGIDFFRVKNGKVIDSVAIGSGRSPSGVSTGDGNGFKMGGGSTSNGSGPNELIGSIAIGCKAQGLNHNSTITPGNRYVNNTSTNNSIGIISDTGGTPAETRNNLVLGNGSRNGEANVGGTQTTNSWQLGISNAQFADSANGDFSLLPGSPAIGSGSGGESNLGASDIALKLLKRWYKHSKIWIPGRGAGPGGTGLPGDN